MNDICAFAGNNASAINSPRMPAGRVGLPILSFEMGARRAIGALASAQFRPSLPYDVSRKAAHAYTTRSCIELTSELLRWNRSGMTSVSFESVPWCGYRVSWLWGRAYSALLRGQYKKSIRALEALLRCPEASLARGPLFCLLGATSVEQSTGSSTSRGDATHFTSQHSIYYESRAGAIDEPTSFMAIDKYHPVRLAANGVMLIRLGLAYLSVSHRVAAGSTAQSVYLIDQKTRHSAGNRLSRELHADSEERLALTSNIQHEGIHLDPASIQARYLGLPPRVMGLPPRVYSVSVYIAKMASAVAFLAAGGQCGSLVPTLACIYSDISCVGNYGTSSETEWGNSLLAAHQLNLRETCRQHLHYQLIEVHEMQESARMILAQYLQSNVSPSSTGGAVPLSSTEGLRPDTRKYLRLIQTQEAAILTATAYRAHMQSRSEVDVDTRLLLTADTCSRWLNEGRLQNRFLASFPLMLPLSHRVDDIAARTAGVVCSLVHYNVSTARTDIHTEDSPYSSVDLRAASSPNTMLRLAEGIASRWATRTDEKLAELWASSRFRSYYGASVPAYQIRACPSIYDVQIASAQLQLLLSPSPASFDLCRFLAVANQCLYIPALVSALRSVSCSIARPNQGDFRRTAFAHFGNSRAGSSVEWARQLELSLQAYSSYYLQVYVDGVLGYWPSLCALEDPYKQIGAPTFRITLEWDIFSGMPCLRPQAGLRGRAAYVAGIPTFLLFSSAARLADAHDGYHSKASQDYDVVGMQNIHSGSTHAARSISMLFQRVDPGCVQLYLGNIHATYTGSSEVMQVCLVRGVCGHSDASLGLTYVERFRFWLALSGVDDESVTSRVLSPDSSIVALLRAMGIDRSFNAVTRQALAQDVTIINIVRGYIPWDRRASVAYLGLLRSVSAAVEADEVDDAIRADFDVLLLRAVLSIVLETRGTFAFGQHPVACAAHLIRYKAWEHVGFEPALYPTLSPNIGRYHMCSVDHVAYSVSGGVRIGSTRSVVLPLADSLVEQCHVRDAVHYYNHTEKYCISRATGVGVAAALDYINVRAQTSLKHVKVDTGPLCQKYDMMQLVRRHWTATNASLAVAALARLGSLRKRSRSPDEVWRASTVSLALAQTLLSSGYLEGAMKVLKLSISATSTHIESPSYERSSTHRGSQTSFPRYSCFAKLLEHHHIMYARAKLEITIVYNEKSPAEASVAASQYLRTQLVDYEDSILVMVLLGDFGTAGISVGADLGPGSAGMMSSTGSGTLIEGLGRLTSSSSRTRHAHESIYPGLFAYGRAVYLIQQRGLPGGTPPDMMCACDQCCLRRQFSSMATLIEGLSYFAGSRRIDRSSGSLHGDQTEDITAVGRAIASQCACSEMQFTEAFMPHSLGTYSALRLGWLALSLSVERVDEMAGIQAVQWFSIANDFAVEDKDTLGRSLARLGSALVSSTGRAKYMDSDPDVYVAGVGSSAAMREFVSAVASSASKNTASTSCTCANHARSTRIDWYQRLVTQVGSLLTAHGMTALAKQAFALAQALT